jgi:hypothetical protein
MRRALCAVHFFLVGFNPALAEVRIEASTGGVVSNYLELFAVLKAVRRTHRHRWSWLFCCTLVLSTIPRNRICALGFHAPRLVDEYGQQYHAPEVTSRGIHQQYRRGFGDCWIWD